MLHLASVQPFQTSHLGPFGKTNPKKNYRNHFRRFLSLSNRTQNQVIQKSKDLPKFLRRSRYGLWRRWHRHFALSASNGQGTLNPWTSCTSSALWCFGYPFRRGKAVNDLNECELVVNSLRLRVSHKVDSYVESHESTCVWTFVLLRNTTSLFSTKHLTLKHLVDIQFYIYLFASESIIH